jgi:hypothetical protein
MGKGDTTEETPKDCGGSAAKVRREQKKGARPT